jgi:hypothetical protein
MRRSDDRFGYVSGLQGGEPDFRRMRGRESGVLPEFDPDLLSVSVFPRKFFGGCMSKRVATLDRSVAYVVAPDGQLRASRAGGRQVDVVCRLCGMYVEGHVDPEGIWTECECGLWTGYLS